MLLVATAPTVYGIETNLTTGQYRKLYWLQQHLPFTVLKRFEVADFCYKC